MSAGQAAEPLTRQSSTERATRAPASSATRQAATRCPQCEPALPPAVVLVPRHARTPPERIFARAKQSNRCLTDAEILECCQAAASKEA